MLSERQKEIRDIAEQDLTAFVKLVAPMRMLGHCHYDLLRFFMQDDHYQLCIWPRGHQKSTMVAYYCAWQIVKNPTITILYTSATADLTEKQLQFIKDILTGPVVAKYWPNLIHKDVNKRTFWRAMEFSVDHPDRKKFEIRYPTCKGAGINGNVTGFHADIVILDDLVVYENAYTKIGRQDVETSYSLFNSVLNTDGYIKAIGTRYHPDDLYNALIEMREEIFDDETGDVISEEPVYTKTIAVVENDGDYLWPRQRRSNDGSWFGFDKRVLSKIRANYLDKSQFYAQYYNDPTDPLNKRIETFQYYERDTLRQSEGAWFLGSRRLNVFAGIDFASTVTKRADYTAIVVIGIDSDHNIYVLDIDRFKTDKISVMQRQLAKLYDKWSWIKLRAEVNQAQNLVVEEIKDLNRKMGIFYTIDKINQIKMKELRIATNLEPRYSAGTVFHYRGGNCQVLEDELRSNKPPHDDISDALASVVEIALAPTKSRRHQHTNIIQFNPRFGGVM